MSSESGDELLNGHLVFADVALAAREDAVVPVVGAACGQWCDVLDGGPVGVVLRVLEADEVHGDAAVAAFVAEVSAEGCVGDDACVGVWCEVCSSSVVGVGGELDTFFAVSGVPLEVLLSDLFVVVGEPFAGAEHLPFLVRRVPGFHFGAAA